MARLPRDNNDAEIAAFDAVCDRLGGFDDRVAPEWVDGYITATATRPLPLLVGDWLPRMAGDAYDRAFADPEDRLQAERALRTRAGVIADQLDAEALFDDPGRMRLAPLMAEWDDAARAEMAAERGLSAEEAAEFVTGGLWADGFMQAVEDHGEEPVAGEEDAFAELLRAVHALRLAEGSDALREHLVATYGRQGADRDQLVDDALYAVQDLRMLRVDSAPVPATRRVEKTPGRNDPCPCGSGRKFKKCHGA